MIISLLLISCSKQDKIDQFEINIEGYDSVIFNTDICEFENQDFQIHGEHILSMPKGYQIFNAYRESNNQIFTEIWIILTLELPNGNSELTTVTLNEIFSNDDFNGKSKFLRMGILLRKDGRIYRNKVIQNGGSNFPFNENENFSTIINEVNLNYQIECVDNKLFYIEATIEGMLYKIDSSVIKDSIYVENSCLRSYFTYPN